MGFIGVGMAYTGNLLLTIGIQIVIIEEEMFLSKLSHKVRVSPSPTPSLRGAQSATRQS
ncbi:MAG: hypothetical protein K0R52_1274 [Alphaproteobacteria bacterium]|nr:hypothetical protein [Alphaproteobacteria bacterium]